MSICLLLELEIHINQFRYGDGFNKHCPVLDNDHPFAEKWIEKFNPVLNSPWPSCITYVDYFNSGT